MDEDKNLMLYFETKNISYLHEWVACNYKVFHTIVNRVLKMNSIYSVDHDELFQEAVILFYSVVDKYNPELGQFSTFLYSVLSNELLNVIKKEHRSHFSKRVNAIELDAPLDEEYGSLTESAISIDTGDVIDTILIKDMEKYVETHCNDRTKSVYQLYTKGYSLTEVGKVLGISKQRVSQIIQSLTADLSHEWGVR